MNRRFQIVIYSVITVFLTAILLKAAFVPNNNYLNGFNFEFSNGKYGEVSEVYEAGNISGLNIDVVSANVSITLSQDDQIKVHVEGNGYDSINQEVVNNVLQISQRKMRFLSLGNMDIEIQLPAQDFYKIDVETVSGTVDVEQINTNYLTTSSTSGEINISDLTTRKIEAQSVSGSVNVDAKSAEFDLESVSGRVDVTAYDEFDKMTIETVSGSVFIRLNNIDSALVDFDSISGKLKNNVNISSQKNVVEVETVSGNCTIN